MNTPYWETKNMIDGMNAAVADRDDDEATLIRLVEPMLFTEFSGRTDDEDFIEYALEAYAAVPKIMLSYDEEKGARLETWGWRLMRNAVLQFIRTQERMRSNEQRMDDYVESDDVTDETATPAWHTDTGWYNEPQGSGSRAMQWKAEYALVYKRLDSRDQTILRSLLRGDTQRQIADLLGITQPTVSEHVTNLMARLSKLA
jgi:RNA polymerase sigma factor (sigma-70 family)